MSHAHMQHVIHHRHNIFMWEKFFPKESLNLVYFRLELYRISYAGLVMTAYVVIWMFLTETFMLYFSELNCFEGEPDEPKKTDIEDQVDL